VEKIQCGVSPLCLNAAGQVEPKTALAGKFSVYYCAALALTAGVAGEAMFTDQLILDPKMIRLRKKVQTHEVPKYKGTEAKVTITTKEGKKYSTCVTVPKGDPRNPITDKELEDKFRAMAAFVIPKEKANLLIKNLWTLEKVKDMHRVVKAAH
jgi:2-methylcitrate dehydratase PrpD